MEITFYSTNGSPEAYLAEDGETIYLWNGVAVAYFVEDKIYGWNGKHLGWFYDGVIYDLSGLQVGFTKEKYSGITTVPNVKNVKHVQNVKNVRSVPYAKPSFSNSKSSEDLTEFLDEGSI